MIFGQHKLAVPNSSSFNIASYKEHFSTIQGNVVVRESTNPTTDWETINWSLETATPLISYTPNPSASWYLFEVQTSNWKGAGLLFSENTSLTPAAFDLILTDVVDGKVYHYSDYLIPLEKYNVTSINIDNPLEVKWELRTQNAYNDDYTVFSNSWDNANILSALSTETNNRCLHLHFRGTRKITLEIDGVSAIKYFNFANNPDFSKSLDGLSCEFQVPGSYAIVNNFETPDIKEAQIIVFSFIRTASTGFTYIFGQEHAGTNDYRYSATVDASKVSLRILDRLGNGVAINGDANEVLKIGRNQVLLFFKGNNYPTPPVPADAEFWVNGRKLETTVSGNSYFPSPPTGAGTTKDLAIGSRLNLGNASNSNLAYLKKLEWYNDLFNNINGLAYEIYNQGSGKYVLNPNTQILNLDFTQNPPQDISGIGYSTLTVGTANLLDYNSVNY